MHPAGWKCHGWWSWINNTGLRVSRLLEFPLDDPDAEQDVAKFIAQVGVHYTILIGDPSVADIYGGVRFMPQEFLY